MKFLSTFLSSGDQMTRITVNHDIEKVFVIKKERGGGFSELVLKRAYLWGV